MEERRRKEKEWKERSGEEKRRKSLIENFFTYMYANGMTPRVIQWLLSLGHLSAAIAVAWQPRTNVNKKLSYRRETARQLHMTTWAGQLTF